MLTTKTPVVKYLIVYSQYTIVIWIQQTILYELGFYNILPDILRFTKPT